ncbi:MAG: GNAT family N-acetyltransferase [Deltaproteobacteria bacterium]|nr:GNAT family N-acetyltransferase [Deltaproteobacteria bacterium]
MMLKIKNMIPDEFDVADGIIQSAFGRTNSMREEIQIFYDSQPDGLFIAYIKEKAIGTGAIVDYGTYSFIGMMNVLKEHQRKGYGRIIFDHLLRWGGKIKTPLIYLDASDMGRGLYEQRGFKALDKSIDYQINSMPDRLTIPNRYGIRIIELSDLDDLVDFDKPFFGGNRREILKNMIRVSPPRGFIAFENCKISGYIIARSQEIGPWIAKTPDVAETLLQVALTLPYERNPSIVVPESNKMVINILKRHQFEKKAINTHMVLGSNQAISDRQSIFAQIGHGLG